MLVTSGTVTSKARRAAVAAGVIHQFVPFDSPLFVRASSRIGGPILCCSPNPTSGPTSLSWRRSGDSADPHQRAPVGALVQAMAVSARDHRRAAAPLRSLPHAVVGLCRALSRPGRATHQHHGQSQARRAGAARGPRQPASLAGAIGGRPTIAAASTHAGEEAAFIDTHRRLRVSFPNLLTIIAPRHPDRGPGIVEIAKAAGLTAALRSQRAAARRGRLYRGHSG